jgi:hypothetical protein
LDPQSAGINLQTTQFQLLQNYNKNATEVQYLRVYKPHLDL